MFTPSQPGRLYHGEKETDAATTTEGNADLCITKWENIINKLKRKDKKKKEKKKKEEKKREKKDQTFYWNSIVALVRV